MKLTIIPADGAVYRDNVSFSRLDLSTAPAEIHALQWFDTKGWIEFHMDEDFNKPTNEIITELPQWVDDALAKWDAASAALEAQMQEQAAAAANAVPPVTE